MRKILDMSGFGCGGILTEMEMDGKWRLTGWEIWWMMGEIWMIKNQTEKRK